MVGGNQSTVKTHCPLNVMYKVVAKILANRIRPLLDDIISPQQATFVLGRQIMDNVVVA